MNITISTKNIISESATTDIVPEKDGFLFVIPLPKKAFTYFVDITIKDPKGLIRELHFTVEGKISELDIEITAIAAIILIGLGLVIMLKKKKKLFFHQTKQPKNQRIIEK